MLREDLLRILRCPLSHQALKLADEALVARVNAAIEQGSAVNRVGTVVTRRLDGGLVNEQGNVLYPIRNDIPCLLADEAIVLAPFLNSQSAEP